MHRRHPSRPRPRLARWSEEELCHLLGTNLGIGVRHRRRKLRATFAALVPPLCAFAPTVFAPSVFTWDAYLWCARAGHMRVVTALEFVCHSNTLCPWLSHQLGFYYYFLP